MAKVRNILRQPVSFWRKVIDQLGLAQPVRISENPAASKVFFEWRNEREVEKFCRYTHNYKGRDHFSLNIV